jgi:WD40 repeat protein
MRAAIVLVLVLTSTAAGAVTGRGGLEAVAASPDGKRVAVGGQNRVVYLLDAGSLEVTRRVWLGARVGALAFSKDGSRLVAEDETDRLHLIDPATGKTLARLADARGLAVHVPSDLGAVVDRTDLARNRLRLFALDTLKERRRIELPGAAVTFAFTADGKQLAVLGASEPTDVEKRVPLAEVPRELTGLARWTFRLKHDGRRSRLWLFEVPSGKLLRQQALWYTSDGDTTVLAPSGATTFVLNRTNLCARITGDGATTLFETPQRVNHALGVSPDGKVLVTGGFGEGTHGALEGGKHVLFSVEALPGQGEYFHRFAVSGDGSAWGVTTAFRVVRLGPRGKVEKAAAVY